MVDYSSTDDGLRWWAVHDPGKRAIVTGGEAVTFAELDAWVDRVAADLADTGVGVGDRVGVVGYNCVEWAVAGLAVLRRGAVLAALSERLTSEEIHGLTTFTDTRAVYVAETHRDQLSEVVRRRPSMITISHDEVSRRRAGDRHRFNRPDIDATEPAAIVYSSGSTGMPKGIVFSMAALVSQMHEWAATDPAQGRDARICAVLPLSPMGGFCSSVLRGATVGCTVFLQPKFDERDALRLVLEEKCTSLMAPPLIFERISVLPEFENADLSTLTYALIGGAPVPLAEFNKWLSRGAALRQIYGSTEAGGHFSAMPAELAAKNPSGAGRGNMHRRIKAVRADGSDCPPGEDGEILVRGPGMMSGYWNDPEATEAVLRDGWLHTGDLGRIDDSGVLTVTDRIKEIIISGGYNIGPTEVEKTISQLEQVDEVVVIPLPDPKWGEIVGAVVTLSAPLSVEDIVAHCNVRLADYKIPRHILITEDALPRSTQGKFSKMDVRDRYTETLLLSPRVR